MEHNDFGSVRSDLTTSGHFISMDRAGQLVHISSLIQKRARFANDLNAVDQTLRACNDPRALAEFAVWCSIKGRSFEAELRKRVRTLEARKDELLKCLKRAEDELAQNAPLENFEITPSTSTLVPRVKVRNQRLALRDEMIAKKVGCTHENICRMLDFEFGSDSVPAPILPSSWTEKFGVTTFRAAYRNPDCRRLVHKMFSSKKRAVT